MIEIIDREGTSGRAIVERYNVATTIHPWFPDAPRDVSDAIEELQGRLNRGEDTTAVAEFLGLIVVSA